MGTYFKCHLCGMQVNRTGKNQKYCPVCKEKIKNERPVPTFICIGCGKETPRNSANQKWCHECSAKFRKPSKVAVKPESIYKHEAKPEYGNGEGNWTLTGKTLTEIALEAKALGVSYGLYVNLCSSGKMKEYLEAHGMSVQKAKGLIRKAKNDNEKRRKEKR